MTIDGLAAAHPYHPPDVVLEGFVPQQLPFEQTLAYFFAATFIVLFAGWRVSGGAREGRGRRGQGATAAGDCCAVMAAVAAAHAVARS